MRHTGCMQLIDTHCHLHDVEFFPSKQAEEVYKSSADELEIMILIGTSLADSNQAVLFSNKHPKKTRVAIGVHPHEAARMDDPAIAESTSGLGELVGNPQVVAIGECGLDFFYNNRQELLKKQTLLLEGQLQLALDNDLAVSFHVREAFDDFWPILKNFKGLRGVLHSFSDSQANVEMALKNNLYIGVNGIATFTKHEWQREVYKNIPIENIVLETDAPFLTPHPIRGTMNEPKNVTYITNFLAELRGEHAEQIAQVTTTNARKLFRL